MWNVRRQDLGTDIVVLPQRNLVVFHPDLDYAESLGALMATMPEMHLDVAKRTVEKVTPRPRPEPRRWPLVGLRVALASLATAAIGAVSLAPASAMPEFGPIWSSAIADLGIDCRPTEQPDVRACRNEQGDQFEMGGARHETGTLYASTGPNATVIFVFDHEVDARRYVEIHPTAQRSGRAVIW